ncbi:MULTISPECIES: TetR/AcrR family transcriptional regulator [Xenorhabdus]|uniref:TetR/AcrR family transcriptional regulator n=1 Tax=Xenorhabdus TaxID=626 RepID=UPI00064A1B64|nr:MULTISPECIES: TetR family transcriptional regulator [Xenorhabdus]KLU17291.1 TetR family transcriptional regulator [Xenorhabdus griffiniae]KOP33145.1 TetR family transcriptional regulator [Xenorhabdus sp. GDc328]
MGRRKTIDREVLLDAAEQIVTTHGAAALTIDALAKAVGITKGGVQYSFSTKDGLIDAMFERWEASYDEQFHEIAGHDPHPLTAVRAHIEATRRSDEASTAKAAGLMAALLQTPEHLESTRIWYRQRIAGLDTTTEEGRQARLAFLATEGAFVLRFFGLMDMSEDEWGDIFTDILAAVSP